METFRLPIVAGKTFTRENITLNGKRFEKCKFIECTIVYSGGPAEADSCEFSPNTLWVFQEPISTSLQVLQQFGWRFEYGPAGPLAAAIPVPNPKV